MLVITRRVVIAVAAAALSIFLAGCGNGKPGEAAKKAKAPAGDAALAETKQLSVNGVQYSYLQYIPAACKSSAPCPVLIGLHGRGATSADAMNTFQMVETANQHGVIVIAPQAIESQWHDAEKGAAHDQDMAMFDQLFATVPSINGDPNRIYIVGHSNGAGEAFYVAAERSTKVAAVVGAAASIAALDNQWQFQMIPDPTRHVSVMMIHGMEDPISGYDLSTFTIDVPSAVEWWADKICPNTKEVSGEIGKGQVLDRHWTGADKAEVELLAYKRLGHAWPAVSDRAVGFKVNDKIWEFLSRHSLKTD